MKKIFLLFICLIPLNVYSENIDNYNEIKKYKYYYLEKDYSDTYNDINYSDEYYSNISDDYILSDIYMNFEKPDGIDIVNLEEKNYTSYKEYTKVRYIIFDNFISNSIINFAILNIYERIGGELKNKINYEVLNHPNVLDGSNKKTFLSVNDESYVIIKLEKDMNINDLYVVYWFYGDYLEPCNVRINFNNTGDVNDLFVYKNSYSQLNSNSYTGFDYYGMNFVDSEIKYTEDIDSLDRVYVIDTSVTGYNYQKKLYKYYGYKKVYLDDYYEIDKLDDNYYIDEDDYIIEYEKIENNGDNKINNIEKEIIEDSEEIQKVENNNYNKNKVYKKDVYKTESYNSVDNKNDIDSKEELKNDKLVLLKSEKKYNKKKIKNKKSFRFDKKIIGICLIIFLIIIISRKFANKKYS